MRSRTSTILGIITALGIAAVIVLSTTTLGDTIIGVVSITGTTTQNVTLQTGLALDSSLVGHWTFDGKNMVNNVADVSGTGNNGFLQNQTPTTTARGVIGQAMQFDGQDDYIRVEDSTSLVFGDSTQDFPFSLAAWIKMNNAVSFKVVAKAENISNPEPEFIFGTRDGNDTLRLLLYDNDNSDSTLKWTMDATDGMSQFEGEWTHVIATYDGAGASGSGKMYINGEEVSTSITVGSNYVAMHDLSNILTIGGSVVFDSNWDQYSDGEIDDVRIYNRALTAEEVSRLYEVGATTRKNVTLETGLALDSNLLAHWTFDGEDMISNVADRSGQGNHGALQGQTSTTTSDGIFGQAIDFDGSDDYVDVGNIGSVSVVSFWIKPDSVTSIDIIDIDGTDKIETDGSGNIVATSFPAATIYVNGSSDSATITAGEWNHVAIVDTTGVSATDFDIARIEGEGNFAGVIDDVRLYSRALSAWEVLRLAQLGGKGRTVVLGGDPDPSDVGGTMIDWKETKGGIGVDVEVSGDNLTAWYGRGGAPDFVIAASPQEPHWDSTGRFADGTLPAIHFGSDQWGNHGSPADNAVEANQDFLLAIVLNVTENERLNIMGNPSNHSEDRLQTRSPQDSFSPGRIIMEINNGGNVVVSNEIWTNATQYQDPFLLIIHGSWLGGTRYYYTYVKSFELNSNTLTDYTKATPISDPDDLTLPRTIGLNGVGNDQMRLGGYSFHEAPAGTWSTSTAPFDSDIQLLENYWSEYLDTQ